MSFVSFFGRVLFASFFLLSAFQEFNEFGVDGGPAANALKPKFDIFSSHVSTHLGAKIPEIEMKHLVAAAIALKGLGGFLFVVNSSLGAILLILYIAVTNPIVNDFYNYHLSMPQFLQVFVKFTEALAILGALLFFLGMKTSMPKRQPKKKALKAKNL